MDKFAVVINGPAGIGKDLFIKLCQQFTDRDVITISSVDRVKEAAALLGWDGKKDETGRQFLSDLKDLSTEAYNGPMRDMLRCWDLAPAGAVVFFHIREPEEIDKFLKELPATTLMIYGHRPEMTSYDNHADRRVHERLYDVYYDNSHALGHLEIFARNFIQQLTRRA